MSIKNPTRFASILLQKLATLKWEKLFSFETTSTVIGERLELFYAVATSYSTTSKSATVLTIATLRSLVFAHQTWIIPQKKRKSTATLNKRSMRLSDRNKSKRLSKRLRLNNSLLPHDRILMFRKLFDQRLCLSTRRRTFVR